MSNLDLDEWSAAIKVVESAWKDKKKIITCGNGGSALTALHFIADWNKSVFIKTSKPFYGCSMVDNIGLMMAYANDVSYDDIFVEQLKNIAQKGDLVIFISGSGNSVNIINAAHYAAKNELNMLALCGYDGGILKKVVDTHLHVKSFDMQIVEDMHLMFGHLVMKKLCNES